MGAISNGDYKKFGYGTGTGEVNISIYNNQNNNGHSVAGVVGLSLFSQIGMPLMEMGAQKLANSTENTLDVDKASGDINGFLKVYKNFNNAVADGDTKKAQKYGKELQDIYNNNQDNRTITRYYDPIKANVEKYSKTA